MKKIISLFMAFTLMLTLIKLPTIKTNAEENDTQVGIDSEVILTGDFLEAQGIGTNWAPEKHEIIMKEFNNGIYFGEVEFKTTGNFSYKVAMNGSWDESYGKDGENVSLKVSSPQKVIFLFDYKDKILRDSINDTSLNKTSATLVGLLNQTGGSDWVPSDSTYDLSYIGSGFYKKEFNLKAGSYEYKVAYNHNWSNGEIADNIKLNLDKDSKVTILANPYINLCVDSINNPEILKIYSLIGTVRGVEEKNWDQAAKGYEFNYIGGGKFIYSNLLSVGEYEYKACVDYKWDNGELPAGGNNSLKLDKDKHLVFIVDTKANKIYDSINNPSEIAEALGLKSAPQETKSPVINGNGSVTFQYKDEEASRIYLAGSMTDWDNGKKLMTRDKQGVWSITLRLGDEEKDYEYKFIVDGKWMVDPLNSNTLNGNSLLKFPRYEGRKVVIAGTVQPLAGEGNWTPGSDKTKMIYKGNGLYELTIKNVPEGKYEYKVAMGSWTENYGLNGKAGGENIPLVVTKAQDVTFYYSDDSHRIVDSVSYKKVNAYLKGKGIEETELVDLGYTGIYSTMINLNKGIYENLILEIRDDNEKILKTIEVPKIEIKEDNKLVTMNYDPVTEMVFNDASTEKVDTNGLYFNSKEIEYKKPFGAVKDGEEVTFNLKTNKDEITLAKMVITSETGTEVLDMSKDGSFDEAHDKWALKKSFSKIGTYKYYFIVTNGSDIKAYGDDDGYFGAGIGADLGGVKPYEVNVYKADFKTPDWMKNAVVYQIFPDRFFNGDNNNDYLQKYARGEAPYEFYEDWYSIPENPSLAYEKDENGNFIIDSNGKPKVKEGYNGILGDGYKDIWCNEMYGGDLVGIEKKLDYLQALGVTVLYLNPASKSISNHRYDTTDYKEVDPLLGDMDNFVNLAKAASERNMHLILDGVFNHVSDDSIYFDRYGKYMAKNKPIGAYQYWSRVYDLMNVNGINQQEAEKLVKADLASQGITDLHYKDWFKVDNVKVKKGAYEYYQYEGWYGYDSMPVIQALDGSEYNVETWADEIIDGEESNTRYWLEKGSNGWRLDVANEVSDETWQYFRAAVKEESEDNVIIGEIWTDASKYLLGDMYDSVMNYRFRDAVLGYLRDNKPVSEIVNQLELIREQYPEEAFYAMLNLVDSHDTERILTALDGVVKDSNDAVIAKEATEKARKLQKLVPLIQMTYAGAPCIYYGDEAGMVGAKDPDNRRGFTWGKGDKETVETYAALANIRNNYQVLRTGGVSPAEVTGSGDVLAYERYLDNDNAMIAINRSEKDVTVEIKINNVVNGTILTDTLTGAKYTVAGGKVNITLKAVSGAILVNNYKETVVSIEKLKDAYAPEYIVKNTKAPKTDEVLINEIKEASKNGLKEVVVSEINEEISIKVLEACKENNIKPVIKRGDVIFTIESPEKLLQAVKDAGLTGLLINVKDLLRNQEAAQELKDKFNPELFKELNIETNIPNGEIISTVKISLTMGEKYNDKNLYVYYINGEGKAILIQEITANNGTIEFTATHFSEYIVTDKALISSDNGNNDGGSDNGSNNGSNDGTDNKSKDENKSGNLPQTGGVQGEVLILLAIMTIVCGSMLLKNKKIKNKCK